MEQEILKDVILMLEDCICIDLADVLSGYIELEKVFPKEQYKD